MGPPVWPPVCSTVCYYYYRTSADLLPWLPGKRKKVRGAALGAAADRTRPPTVPGHQGDRPGTPGRTHGGHRKTCLDLYMRYKIRRRRGRG